MDQAESTIVQIVQNAVESVAPSIRATVDQIYLTSYQRGIAQGRKDFLWIVPFWVKLQHRLVTEAGHYKVPAASELHRALRDLRPHTALDDVTVACDAVGLPLDDEFHSP